jgi:hypothetical protein
MSWNVHCDRHPFHESLSDPSYCFWCGAEKGSILHYDIDDNSTPETKSS